MTGNRTPGYAQCPRRTMENNGTTTEQAPRSRRPDSAPHGVGLKAKPAARVDLRSSLDPDPSTAYARTEPGNRRNRSQPTQPQGLTRPRSFRDDTEGSQIRKRTECGRPRSVLVEYPAQEPPVPSCLVRLGAGDGHGEKPSDRSRCERHGLPFELYLRAAAHSLDEVLPPHRSVDGVW
jgi:hypothetical protein